MGDLKVMPTNPGFKGNQWDIIVRCIENGYSVLITADMWKDHFTVDLYDKDGESPVMMCDGLCYHTHVSKELHEGNFLGGLGPGLEVDNG